jgi:glycosyltransferase involved in cell wall biosynthesis
LRISACIGTLNEEHNIAACIESLRGADEVIVADDGSTYDTVKIALECGAQVFRRKDHAEYATQEDVNAFIERFGWEPTFKPGQRIRNGHLEAQEVHSRARYEWIVQPDADERVSWDLERLKAEVLPNADQVQCEFVHAHNEDGSPVRVSHITMMFRATHADIRARTHTVIVPEGRIVSTDLMRIDHWQRPGHSQSYVLAILEYCCAKEYDLRSRFYLGREYYYYNAYDQSIDLLDRYLTDATWMPEIGMANLYKARSCWEAGYGDRAREACTKCVLLNPDHTEALHLMAELHFEPWKSKWAAIAERSTGKDVLF